MHKNMRNKFPQRNINIFGSAFQKIRISLLYCIYESTLYSEYRSRFTKSLAKDDHVAFATLSSTECGQDIVRNHAENLSHLATT